MTREKWELMNQGLYEPNEYDDRSDIGFPFTMINSDETSSSEYQIFVFANDGIKPHFHIMKTDFSFDCSLCTMEPKYYEDSKDCLSAGQIEFLMNRFQQVELRFATNTKLWDLITLVIRSQNFDQFEKFGFPKMPNYQELII